jgi:hypothetical protein
MMTLEKTSTKTEHDPDFRVVVTWVEITTCQGKQVRLNYAKTYAVATLEDARALRARALQNNGWAPSIAHEVEITLGGLDAPDEGSFQSQSAFRAGIAQVRAALESCNGPLAADIVGSIGHKVDRKRQAAGERVAS